MKALHGDADCGSPDDIPDGIRNEGCNQESNKPGSKEIDINFLSCQLFALRIVGLRMHPFHEPQIFYQKKNTVTNHGAGNISMIRENNKV